MTKQSDSFAARMIDSPSKWRIEMADRNAAGLYHEKLDLSQVGGFGVRLFNRFGGEVEVGVGRDLWLLLILKPGSCRICGDQPQQKGMLVFYLDGWHHTEMEKSSLISRDEGLRCLREWLNSGIVPNSANNR
jgi:uncharacterized protein YneR